MSGDRLAQIEAAVEITLRRARDSAGSQPEFVVAPNSVSCADVLALVEIAKAARRVAEAHETGDGFAWVGSEDDIEDLDALAAAVARLDSGATEGEA